MNIIHLKKIYRFLFLTTFGFIAFKNIYAQESDLSRPLNQPIEINQDNSSAVIRIDSKQVTNSNNIKVLELTQPNRIAVDIYTLKDKKNLLSFLETFKKTIKENGYIKSIRTGDYSDKIRIVFDLSIDTKYSAKIIKEPNFFEIDLNNFDSSKNNKSESIQLNIPPTFMATTSPTSQSTATQISQFQISATQTPTILVIGEVKESPFPSTATPTVTPVPTSIPTLEPKIIINNISPTPIPLQSTAAVYSEVKTHPSEILGVYFTTRPKNQLIFKLDRKRAFTFNPLNDNRYILKIEGLKEVKDSFLLPFYAPKNFQNIESLIIDKNNYDIFITVDEPSAGSSGKVKNLRAFSKGDEIIIE